MRGWLFVVGMVVVLGLMIGRVDMWWILGLALVFAFAGFLWGRSVR